MDKLALIHPFLFLLASIFFLYSKSSVIASPDQMLRPSVFMVVLLGGLSIPTNKMVRDWKLTGIFLSIFVVGIYSNIIFSLQVAAAVLTALLIWLGYMTVRKYRPTVGQAINLVNLVSLGFAVAYGYSHFAELPKISESSYTHNFQSDRFPSLNPGAIALPDIYYIVLDGYGRADVLNDLYLFDNSHFIQFLENKGFFVPLESRSNYPKTALSITSTLNMEYINDLTRDFDDYPYWWLMSPLIDHSRIRILLEQAGYQSISIASDWGITDNPTSDIYYSPFPLFLTDFESFILGSTPMRMVKPPLSKIAFVPSYTAHRNLVEYNFTKIAEIPEIPGPKFTFAHIIAPHPPFVFDAAGNFIEPGYPFSFNEANDFPLDAENYRQGYVGQLQFINGRLERLIEVLIDNSRVPPIIILQADHGPGMFTDFRSSGNTCLKERFAVFAAYNLPGINPGVIPEDITPVNLFRIILNEYFGSDLPLLDRFHYYYKDTVYIFREEEITEQVDTCSQIKTN